MLFGLTDVRDKWQWVVCACAVNNCSACPLFWHTVFICILLYNRRAVFLQRLNVPTECNSLVIEMENSSLSSDDFSTQSSFPSTGPVNPPYTRVIYPIIGTVGILDNLFVIIVFVFFIKVADKVFITSALYQFRRSCKSLVTGHTPADKSLIFTRTNLRTVVGYTGRKWSLVDVATIDLVHVELHSGFAS